MNILITGGAGFIGSTLGEFLLNKGDSVICYDNFDPFYPAEIKKSNIASMMLHGNFRMVEGDINDTTLLSSVFNASKIDLVIHLAAKAGVRPSILDPRAYENVNVAGTLNLLEVMKQHKVRNMLFASSSSIYGNNEKIPYSETDNVDFPISPYAASKKGGELFCFNYHHLYNFNIICLRFFTVYGPRQRPDLAIHKFFNAVYNGKPIDVYGDGTTSRDYTYVDDIVNGVYAAQEYLMKQSRCFEIINLGNSNPVSLNHLIESIEKFSGRKFTLNRLPMQQGDVNRTFADIAKAKQLLNYEPATSLEAGLLKFRNWYEQVHA